MNKKYRVIEEVLPPPFAKTLPSVKSIILETNNYNEALDLVNKYRADGKLCTRFYIEKFIKEYVKCKG